jgi:regulator of sigma E protease
MMNFLEPYWIMVYPIIVTVVGLGFLIFIHEFGHFFVAKRAGVKVEVFSLGIGHFVFSWYWKGTIYALSLLPLGGYVRMAGQQDIAPPPGHKPKPWEYGAKRPVVRMAIIVAGVIMNFFGAWLCFSAAHYRGMDVIPAVVSGLDQSNEADKACIAAGIKNGDLVTAVNGQKVYSREDLAMRLARTNLNEKMQLTLHRQGQDRIVSVPTTYGFLDKGLPSLSFMRSASVPEENVVMRHGFSAETALLIKDDLDLLKSQHPGWAGLVNPGDRVLSIGGKLLASQHDGNDQNHEVGNVLKLIEKALKTSAGQPVVLGLRAKDGSEREEKVPVKARYVLGINFSETDLAEDVLSVRPGTPAQRAGIKIGDKVFLDSRCVGVSIIKFQLAVKKAGRNGREYFIVSPDEVKPRAVRIAGEPIWHFAPVVYVSKGSGSRKKKGPRMELNPWILAYIVKDVAPVSDAFRKGLRPGDVLHRLSPAAVVEKPIILKWYRNGKAYGPYRLAWCAEGPSIAITRVLLQPSPEMSLGQSLIEGWSDSVEVLVTTTVAIRKVLGGKVQAKKALSGPVSIAKFTYISAQQGMGRMLWLLGMLGVSLAFFNLLPIPVLDGGHLVFLIYEAIFRKPASPRIVEIAQYAGLLLILTLFVFVTFNDIFR